MTCLWSSRSVPKSSMKLESGGVDKPSENLDSLDIYSGCDSLNFQGLHNTTLNEKSCSARVCEVFLYLLSTLMDLGLLVNANKNADQKLSDGTKIEDPDILSDHNMCMDIIIR